MNIPVKMSCDVGPTFIPKCPYCGNSFQNAVIEGESGMRCADCKRIFFVAPGVAILLTHIANLEAKLSATSRSPSPVKVRLDQGPPSEPGDYLAAWKWGQWDKLAVVSIRDGSGDGYCSEWEGPRSQRRLKELNAGWSARIEIEQPSADAGVTE